MTDLLLETDLDARQRDYAQTVRNSGEALLTIINDILDFSKVEAGKLEIEEIDFDLRHIVDDVVDLLAGPAQTKGLELVAVDRTLGAGDRPRRSRPGPPGPDQPHRQRDQVHRRPARSCVRVSDAPRPAATTPSCRFEVSDTGDGIAPDKLDADLPAVRPGRHVDVAQVRRHRSGPGDQQPARRADGRRLRRAQRARRGQHVLVHDPGAASADRRASTTARPDAGPRRASRARSSTTTRPSAPSCPRC